MTDEELLRTIECATAEGATRLDLSDKGLTALPPEIGQLPSLTELYLSGNRLTVLPPELGHLSNLSVLYLRNNQLTVLPPELGHLSSLTQLSLDNNELTVLPPELGHLPNLAQLYLRNNQLIALPPELGHLSSLRKLALDSNPLSSPPPEIVEQGAQAVVAYCKERLDGSARQWLSKLLVVGEGGVGKTSLLRGLRGEAYIEELVTTHGIEIRSLELPHPAEPGVTMTLKTWDFGGQELYHATHQFFLTNRSLFLLVWNARDGFKQGALYYWLDTIRALAPYSPVLLVATHTDQRDADIPLADLRRKYPQILGQCAVSNTTGAGIQELRRTIAVAAATLPLMGELWPTTWLNAAEAVRALPEKHITPQRLEQTMAAQGVAGTSAAVLARWLHELGEILYFRDNDELNDTVILKPQWVTEYISKVLESEEVIVGDGIFTRRQMDQLWRDLDPSMREHFLRLMERFDLSYRSLEDPIHWRTQDAVLTRMDDLKATVVVLADAQAARHDELIGEFQDLRALVQREFTNAFRREQAQLETRCPNVFVLRPLDAKGIRKALGWQTIELHLCCQAPGAWHTTKEGRRYAIDDPPQWFKQAAPLLHRLIKVLKYAAPIAGAVAPWASKEFGEYFKYDIKLTEEVIKGLPSFKDDPQRKLAAAMDETADPDRAEGSALRAIRLFLEQKDPRQSWGGLKPVLTPEGHYLWLCEHHAAEYAL